MQAASRIALRNVAFGIFVLTSVTLILVNTAPASTQCGVWSVSPTPNPSPQRNLLRGVAAVSPSDVWAVGDNEPVGDVQRTLVMHWNGSAWNVVPSPDASVSGSSLNGVAALSASDAWAVGYSSTFGESQALIMRWTGESWSTVPSPVIDGGSGLWAVTAISDSDIWAVGVRAAGAPGPTSGTLAVHWDGSSWTVVPSPNVAMRSHRLMSVSASASNDVWAVGNSRNIAEPYQPLVLHWDGSAWSVVPVPGTFVDADLTGVAVLAPDDVWAVGTHDNGGTLAVLFLHWDGDGWTEFPSPGGGGGIAALAPDDIWSVGTDIVHWDGSSWTLANSPVAAAGTLASTGAIAVLPGCDAWSVGRTILEDGTFVTLAERLSTQVTGVGDRPAGSRIPALGAPWPNPTTRFSTMSFELPARSRAEVRVFDVRGREVRVLLSGELERGPHEASWDGRNAAGRTMPAGVYFVSLFVNGKAVAQQRITMLH